MIQLSQRFIITENCNASCPHCFNANVRGGGTIDADILIEYLKKNSGYIRKSDFRMMGGEPTLHPRFADIVDEAAKHVRRVKIYTNGLKMKEIVSNPLVMIPHFANKVLYILNGYVFNIDKVPEYQKYVKQLAVHMVVTLDDVDTMIEKTLKYIEMFPFILPVISPDSQVNIFDEDTLNRYRKVWMKAATTIIPRMDELRIPVNVDHYFPMCFYTQDMINELAVHDMQGFHRLKHGCCAETRMGLIDWNFDLYYCNQARIKIGSILNDNGKPKSMIDIVKMINQKGTSIKTEKIMELSDMCRDCAALPACKLGCFYNTLERECGKC